MPTAETRLVLSTKSCVLLSTVRSDWFKRDDNRSRRDVLKDFHSSGHLVPIPRSIGFAKSWLVML